MDAEDIAEVVSKWTGIPVNRMLQSEREKLIHLEDELHKRVVGQEEAIAAIADAVRTLRTGPVKSAYITLSDLPVKGRDADWAVRQAVIAADHAATHDADDSFVAEGFAALDDAAVAATAFDGSGLPADRLDVRDVTDSYKSFIGYERQLAELRESVSGIVETNGDHAALQPQAQLAGRVRLVGQHQPVPQHIRHQVSHVFGQGVGATAQHGQRACAFDKAFLVHKQAADIGVDDPSAVARRLEHEFATAPAVLRKSQVAPVLTVRLPPPRVAPVPTTRVPPLTVVPPS